MMRQATLLPQGPSSSNDEDDLWSQRALEGEVERLRREVSSLRAELQRLRSAPAPSNKVDTRITRDWEAPSFPPHPPARQGQAEAPLAPFPAAPSGPTFVLAPGQGIDFGAVTNLSPEELDSLPYGLITLDAKGRILHYNDTESRMVGLPKERVLGREFFGDVAPCARVREFQGRFEELVRDPYRIRVQTFDFVFRFPNGEQQVTIVLTPAKARGQYNMALLRRGGLTNGR